VAARRSASSPVVRCRGFRGNLHVVSEAFAETGNDDDDTFTPLTTRVILDRACGAAGLDADGASLIRLGENAMFRLREPVVVRIARTAAYEPDARKEVAVARWLEAESYPAVRALPIDQPLTIDGRVVTFWEALSDQEVYGSPADVATLLTRLHDMRPRASLGLKPLRPFGRAERRIENNGWFSPEDRSFLRNRLGELRTAYADLRFVLPAGVIHGDASVGNVICDRDGRAVLIDLDGFAIGPREWDLVLTAIYYDSFGWHTEVEYAEFVSVYGFDVMEWPGYPVLRDVREFLMVTWLSQKAGHDERAAAETRKRIAALRSGRSKRDWQPY
jgi:thiamine kinase-like enzyme